MGPQGCSHAVGCSSYRYRFKLADFCSSYDTALERARTPAKAKPDLTRALDACPTALKAHRRVFRFLSRALSSFFEVASLLLSAVGSTSYRLIVIQRRKHAGASPRSDRRASGAQQGPESSHWCESTWTSSSAGCTYRSTYSSHRSPSTSETTLVTERLPRPLNITIG